MMAMTMTMALAAADIEIHNAPRLISMMQFLQVLPARPDVF
jgi:hypothetical protein